MKAASDDGFSELSMRLTASRLNSDVHFLRLLMNSSSNLFVGVRSNQG